ncbi:MAG TPA: hypothetical protein DEQ77_04055 [Candidatus Omnitrophica bacterium]|nr:MAG: hypothetical protein A2Y01_06295 [Omnitrophica WOR_2 bacterium GWC2_44_8]HCD37891.1 hypothetical protein [Candidatus Omnitrophota bacterium]
MKRLFSALTLSMAVFCSCLLQEASAQNWQELKSEHFIVYFEQDENFAKEVSYKAEVYYQRIASDLGYARYSNFWTWDNRVKIYIYKEKESFLKATNQPTWSEGMADYRNKQIVSYGWSKGFVESLLPHEMAHLIFRDFVGFKGEVPLWLDEGVAQWAEEAKRREYKQLAKQYLRQNTLLSLDDMMRVDIRNVKEVDKVHVRSIIKKDGERLFLFIGGESLVTLYYLESVTLIGFLMDKYGSVSFVDFCRQLRDGKSLQDALGAAYSTYSIRTLQDLEDRLIEHLEEEK